MIEQRLPEFNQVTSAKTSQLKIPKYDLTLKALELRLTNITKAQINEVRLKLGTSPRSALSGIQLQTYNDYLGLASDPLHLTWNFSERDGKDIISEEIGGWDLTKLDDDLYLEVDLASGLSSPGMYAMAWFTPPQGADASKGQLVQKFVRVAFNASAIGNTRNQMPFDPKGAIVKRALVTYTGTDWTPSADGNTNKFEVKKNGGVVWEPVCSDARYFQTRYRKVPQSKALIADFMLDNNLSGALRTADAKSIEWNLFQTAADTGVVTIFDLLDKPYNL